MFLVQGDYFEASSCLSGLLSVTMVISNLTHQLLLNKDMKYSCFLELRNFPNVSNSDSEACSVRVHVPVHVHACIIRT